MKPLFVVLGLFTISCLSAQKIEQHRWQDRLIVLVSSSFQNEDLETQLAILSTDQSGLEERKLIVYQIIEGRYQKGIGDNPNSKAEATKITKRFGLPTTGFGIYVIGLDGGVKLKKDQPVQLSELFELIDSMPMRRAEMNSNKGTRY